MESKNHKPKHIGNLLVEGLAPLKLVHSTPVTAKKLNQWQRESIATECLTFNQSRWNVARRFGVHIREINDICDQAMFDRGVRAGRNAERFSPVDSPRTGVAKKVA